MYIILRRLILRTIIRVLCNGRIPGQLTSIASAFLLGEDFPLTLEHWLSAQGQLSGEHGISVLFLVNEFE